MPAPVPRISVTCPVCGKLFETTAKRVDGGRGKFCSKSCGATSSGRRHGHSSHTDQSRTYVSWSGMLQRCLNPKSHKYNRYGGAGVTVCKEWLTFDGFLADMGERPEGKSLDRIDNDKGYFKGNCRWATSKEQMANRRRNIRVTYKGEAIALSLLAHKLGIHRDTLAFRIRSGWPESNWDEPPTFRRSPLSRASFRRPAS